MSDIAFRTVENLLSTGSLIVPGEVWTRKRKDHLDTKVVVNGFYGSAVLVTIMSDGIETDIPVSQFISDWKCIERNYFDFWVSVATVVTLSGLVGTVLYIILEG